MTKHLLHRGEVIPVDVAWSDLGESQRRIVLQGDDDEWYGVMGFFDWLDGRRYRVQSRVLIARYRRFVRCEQCGGVVTRLGKAAVCPSYPEARPWRNPRPANTLSGPTIRR